MDWISLRTRIALILLILGLGGEMVKTVLDLRGAAIQSAEEAERALRTSVYRVEGIFEKLLSANRLTDVQWLLSMLAVRDEEVGAVVLAPDGRVVAATHREHRNRPWAEIRDAFAPLQPLDSARNVGARFVVGEDAVMVAQSICLLSPNALRERVCYTYMHREGIAGRRASFLAAHLREAAGRALAIVALSAALWLVLGASLVRRAGRIQAAVHAFGRGDISVRSGVAGHDELGEIGAALDTAFDQLAAKERALADGKQRLQDLFDTMTDGFAAFEVVADAGDAPVDFRFVEANRAFGRLAGVAADQVAGRTLRQVFAQPEPAWLELFAVVARTGVAAEGESRQAISDRTLRLSVYRPAPGRLACVFTDVTDRIQKEAERVRFIEHISKANAELERFAYVAAHDLREPLRTITSFSQLLQRQLGGNLAPDSAEYLTLVVNAALHVNQMISDLQEYGRVRHESAAFGPVESGRALAKALSALGAAMAEAGARVEAEALPSVVADESQLVQLFQNLIHNAVKFRHPDRPPLIRVSARHRGAGWEFSVADNGTGVPATSQDIFEIFRRLDPTRPGTGVGLAVCKMIVERHGGTIGYDNRPEGGTVFRFTLPDLG